MPRVIQIKNAPNVSLAYTVDHVVGVGGINERADVLLVQHLLRLAWQDAPTSKGFRPPGETEPLKVDGLYGTKTQRFIKFFQEEAMRRGATLLQDGRVDAVISGGPRGTISNTMYTILAMNSARNSRAAIQNDISTDAGFPSELRPHFFVDWNKHL